MKLPVPPPAKPGEINYDFIDRFTLAHFAIGICYAYFNLTWFWMLVLAVLWEMIENPLKYYLAFLFPHGTADSWKNMTGDTFAVILGWGLYMHLMGQ